MFTMETLGSRRLVKDLKSLQKNPPAGISVAPNESDSLTWKAIILGPDDTHWEEGAFELTLEFPENYPNQPPVVRFVSQMFHPNIYDDGTICLDILDSQWTPVLDVASILISIQSLLCDPNLDSPANPSAALMYTSDREEYNRKVREMVDQSWRAG